jgi:hypothetical protein
VLFRSRRLPTIAPILFLAVAVPIVAPLGDPVLPSEPIVEEAIARRAQAGRSYERTSQGSVVSIAWDRGDAEYEVERFVEGNWEQLGHLHADPEEGPDPGSLDDQRAAEHSVAEFVTAPLVVGDAERVRIKVLSGAPEGVELRTSTDEILRPAGAAGALTPSATAVVIPGVQVVTRGEWGADEAAVTSRCPEGPSYSSEVRFAVVHHSAGAGASSPGGSAAVVRGIQQHHIFSNGWCDVGYNVLVDQWGQVFEGRVGGLDRNVIGAHAGGFNTNSFGIVMIGNYLSATPSVAQRQSVAKVLAWRLGMAGVSPASSTSATSAGNDRHAAGTTIALRTVIGHRDVGATECPGNGGASTYDYIRFLTWLLQHGAGPAGTTEWVPEVNKPAAVALTQHGAIQPGGSQTDLGQPTFRGWPTRARDLEAAPGGGGWALFGDGTIRSYGGAATLTGGPYWPESDLARDLVVSANGTRAYVLDAFGGMHPLNGSPPISGPYWWGWDVAIRAVLIGDGSSGYLLDAYGAIHPLSGAPAVSGPYWAGWRIARDLEVSSTGTGLYLLDGYGGVYALAGAPAIGVPYLGYDAAVDLEVTSAGAWSMLRSGRLLRSPGSAAITMATMAGVLAPDRVAIAIQ